VSVYDPYKVRLFIVLWASIIAVVALACGGGGIASMEDGRGDHTATLLADGRLLVAGGRDSKAIASVEVYDSTTGEWTASSPMAAARFGHTQTLLEDGTVLVVGEASPELYNPVSGTWSSAGNMAYMREERHATTLLEDGRVLVTGGISEIDGFKETVGFAELYDPPTKTWEPTGDMTEERERHQAVLLKNGTVLVVGSRNDKPYIIGETTAELFDPATGTWSEASKLPNDHGERFTVTLLDDGRVLVGGGGTRGRTLAPNITASMDIYDPPTGEWSNLGDMTSKSWGHTATTLRNGTILFVGMVFVDIYNPNTGTWTRVGELTEARNGLHTATLLENDTVLIVGGDNITYGRTGNVGGREGLSSVRVYDPAEEW